jgi:lactoylglutathione lyase
MGMAMRFEIFPADLDATADFYTRVLGFALVRDERDHEVAYLSLERDDVRIGALARPEIADSGQRRPPTGAEIVLEVDDLETSRDRVRSEQCPIEEDITARPWGLDDFRLLDPSGYYLRITTR